MKTVIRILFLTLIVYSYACADDLPSNPLPHAADKRIYWTGAGLLSASATADVITTRQLLARGGIETNPWLGAHPSLLRQTSTTVAIVVAQAVLFHFTERSKHSSIRWTGRAAMGLFISNHAQLAACNAGIDTRSPSWHQCTPYAW